MRHAKRSQRLSRPRHQRDALLDGLVRHLILHDQIRTTHARAKEAQRLADRLVTLGKDGSVSARRRALVILRDRSLVRQLFVDVAPRFLERAGGYTRVVRLGMRRGDGAQEAVLAFSLLRAQEPAKPQAARPQAPPKPGSPPKPQPEAAPEKPKKFFEGLRSLWTRKRSQAHAP